MSARGFELETIVEIDRSPAEVFDLISDTRSFKALDAALVKVEPQGPLVEGLRGTFLHRRGGFPALSTWRVARLEAPGSLSVELRGMGYAMTEDVELKATPTGTRATFHERVWPTSLPGTVLVAVSGAVMRRDLRARAHLLKAVLEAEPGSS